MANIRRAGHRDRDNHHFELGQARLPDAGVEGASHAYVGAAHDAFTRLLHRLEPDTATLWVEAEPYLDRRVSVLVLDDSTLGEPYATHIDLVGRHWSGKRHAVVQGISLVTLLWTDGDRPIPCDYRTYHTPTDGRCRAEADTGRADPIASDRGRGRGGQVAGVGRITARHAVPAGPAPPLRRG